MVEAYRGGWWLCIMRKPDGKRTPHPLVLCSRQKCVDHKQMFWKTFKGLRRCNPGSLNGSSLCVGVFGKKEMLFEPMGGANLGGSL
ncbi:hypothetical protein CFP56_031544 [Quercus suber]|uniref:Uncharacterized protein n=1 Tax=Quercus suber TaxID=58331 RepID=A0AAW0JL55_QUESU